MAEGGVDKGANPSDYFWERIPDSMPTKRIYAACGVHDNRLYVVGGSDGMGKALNVTEVLHIPTKKWQTLPNAPNKRIGCTGIVFFDNKMALIGGTGDKKDPVAEIDVLNLTTNQWEHMPPLPMGVVKPYVALVGRNIYIFGGSTEGIKPLKRAACFNIDKYEWSPLPDMPTARYSLEGYLDGTKLYLVGGRSGKSACPALECFDIEAKTWESLPPFPHNKTFYGVVGHNKNIFVIGGIDPKKGIVRTVDRFSIKDKEWIKAPAVFSARADFASGVIGGRIVCVAGMGGGDQPKPLDDGETITNTYKKWQRIPNMMRGRSSVSCCLHENKLYVVGGAGEGGPQGLVEILQRDGPVSYRYDAFDNEYPARYFGAPTIGVVRWQNEKYDSNMDVGSASAQKKLIVVGAGIAGISAAKELCKHSAFDVKILEASQRVGGRVLTMDVDGVPVELGATYIHGTTNNVIYELAKRYGLVSETTEHESTFSMTAVLSNGDPIPNDAIMKCWNKWSILTNDEYVDISKYKDLYDYYAGEYPKLMKEEDHSTMGTLTGYQFNSIFECFLKFESVAEGLKDCKNINLNDDYINLPGNRETRFDEGYSYSSLVNKLVDDLPKNTILYGREVVNINTENDVVLIKCRNGDQFEADYVIITVSLGVLKRRCLDENLLPNECSLFTPALPVEKLEAIRNLGFGQVGKIVLQFDQEISPQHNSECLVMLWLAEDKHDPVIQQKFSWATDLFILERIHDSYFYESWVAGSTVAKVERATKEEIGEAFLYVLSKMLRHPVPKLIDVFMHSWTSDSLFGGCYTVNLANIDTSASILTLRKPLIDNRVLFAGEATSIEYYSTVHGAYCTGVREAKRLKDM